ncbi:MAG: hypothetical protein CL477_08145 [Acidobacteria bacterium]|jgi:hypothetical protein|nr:hypothetical protein [Acidobacteriota bacterium]HJN44305.1 hypothetical protein [Vicinamibacterales bacterium]|tara:strand:- start:154 stop:534 length:381 start_codon:yes stop_codon:yes gene_type:complete
MMTINPGLAQTILRAQEMAQEIGPKLQAIQPQLQLAGAAMKEQLNVFRSPEIQRAIKVFSSPQFQRTMQLKLEIAERHRALERNSVPARLPTVHQFFAEPEEPSEEPVRPLHNRRVGFTQRWADEE